MLNLNCENLANLWVAVNELLQKGDSQRGMQVCLAGRLIKYTPSESDIKKKCSNPLFPRECQKKREKKEERKYRGPL